MAKIIRDEPEQVYRKAKGFNCSTGKNYLRSPAHGKYSEPKESQALNVGKAFHCAGLEPHEFESRFECGPETRRGNAWKAAYEQATNQGRTLLTADDYAYVLRMRDAIQKNTEINNLVSANNKLVEVSCYWEHGVEKKARMDLVVDDGGTVVDLKTTQDASRDGFSRAVANYYYHMQDAWYSEGARVCFGKEPTFLFIAVEKEPPFANAIYELDARTKAEGQAMMDIAIQRYMECERTQNWPGYPSGIQQLSLPSWAYKWS